MPNYIRNKLVMGSRVPEVLDFVKSGKSLFDFNKICPMPEGLDVEAGSIGEQGMEYLILTGTSSLSRKRAKEIKDRLVSMGYFDQALALGKQYLLNIANTGYSTWYEWCIANWGTKWNASEPSISSENTIEFTTAWSGVTELLESLSAKFPDVTFEYTFADEDTGSNCGEGLIENGIATMYIPDNCSRECYELTFKLWPDKREYYKLVDGKYEYQDEDE